MSSVDKNNIVFGGDVPSSATESYGSFGQFALKQFKESGDKVILIDGTTREEITGNKLYRRVVEMAQCLENAGIQAGDVVSLCSENRLEFSIVLFATLCLNATAAPFNITYTEREINHALNLSRPKILFTSKTAAEKIAKVIKRNSFVKKFVIFGKKNTIKEAISYSEFIRRSGLNAWITDFNPEPTDVSNNVALIMCSSGTTGLPKGVQLTQKNVMTVVDRQFDLIELLKEATLLSVIPWFHAFGCLTMVFSACAGAKLVFLSRFEELAFLKCIQDYKVNMALMVPPLMVFLAKHPAVEKYDLSSLQMLLCGAAPLSKETEDAVKERIGVPFVRQGYGLSESTLSLLVQTEEFNKPGSVGVLRPGTYGKVIDTETGKPLGPHERGELCFKGAVIMKGYVNDEKATRETIDEDGWLHTGDVGYYDNDLEFFIVDRIKELIKYKGFQVPPAEIESILLTHPSIKDAGVVGLPDESSGELPFAFVVKQPNVKLTEKEVMDYVADRVSSAKRLRGGVRFVKEIPKNPSGKILRRMLRDMLKKIPKSKL